MSLSIDLMSGSRTVFSVSITGNLAPMAGAAGLYQCLWRPKENGISIAKDLIDPLRKGLADLLLNLDKFTPHNPPNGWGNYPGFLESMCRLMAACLQHPDAVYTAWK